MPFYQDTNQKSMKHFTYIVLALVFLIGLGIGLLLKSNNSASQITIDKNMKIGLTAPAGLPAQTDLTAQISLPAGLSAQAGNFLASINGKAYYPKDCAAANRIKEENIIWFDTREEAEIQGYKPAQNCAF